MGLISYIIEVSITWTILYVLFYAFLRKETFFDINRWYLLSSFLFGLILPFLKYLTIEWIFISNDESVQDTITQIQQLPQFVATSIQPEESWQDIVATFLTSVYITGSIVFFGRFLQGLYSIQKLYRTGRKSNRQGYILIENEKYHLPFSFFNNVFISTSTPLEDDVDHIIRHELKHVESKHTIDVLFLEVIQIFFWFHPMVYLYKSALRQTHEYIADQAVIGASSRKAYSHLLVKQAMPGIQLALTHQFFQSHIKKRIDMMYQSKSTKSALAKYSIAIPILALLVIVFTSQRDAIAAENMETIIKSELPALFEEENEPLSEVTNEEAITPATYKKGERELILFIYKNITYPASARNKGIQGLVQVRFAVDKEGYVRQINIPKEIGGGCGKAATEVINMMNINGPSWNPAMEDGKAVTSELVLPVVYKLESESGEKIISRETANYNFPENSLGPITVTGYATKSTIVNGYNSQFPGAGAPEFIDDEVFNVVEQMPLFGGANTREQSDEKLIDFIYSNLKYPKQALENGTSGRVYVQFIVTKKGNVKQPKIIRNIPDGCGNAALDVINLMMEQGRIWSPGLQRNTPVNVLYTLPIAFSKGDELEEFDKSIKEKLRNKHEELLKPIRDRIEKEIKSSSNKETETKNIKDYRTGIFNIPPNSLIVYSGSQELEEGLDYEVDYQLGMVQIVNKKYLDKGDPITVSFKKIQGDIPQESLQDTSTRPLIVIDGQKSHLALSKATEFIKPNEIEGITVLKDEKAVAAYPGTGNRGVIEITTKNPTKTKETLFEKPNPIYIIDGEVFLNRSGSYIQELNPDDIKIVKVYKDIKANEIYPNSAKRGVVEIITKNPNKSKKPLPEKGTNKSLEVPHEGSKTTIQLNGKAKASSIINPIFIIDGETYIDRSKGSLKELNPDDIKTIKVYKDEAAEKLYPNSSERGVIKITTKDPKKTKKRLADKKSKDSVSLSGQAVSPTNPIYIIDGKTYHNKSDSDMEVLEPDDIESINVYKGEAADRIYPDSGERGIIEITTKNPKGLDEKQTKTGNEEILDEDEDAFELSHNSPNPWKDLTTISFQLPKLATASIKIFDMAGREVYKYSEKFNAGENTITIKKDDLGTSGIYYYELKSGAFSETRKMHLID